MCNHNHRHQAKFFAYAKNDSLFREYDNNESNPTNTQMRMTRMRMRMDDNFFVFVLIFLSITLSPINSNQLESIVVASDGLNECKQLQYYYL